MHEHFITVTALEQNVSESRRSPRWEQQEFDKAGSAALTRALVGSHVLTCAHWQTLVFVSHYQGLGRQLRVRN